MAKPPPNPAVADQVADRSARRAMTRMEEHRNTCPTCKTTYRTHAASVTCENWHS